jgi:hypothetical protein
MRFWDQITNKGQTPGESEPLPAQSFSESVFGRGVSLRSRAVEEK